MNQEDKIKQAAELIKKSNYIVAFTGAGISVESGIPDFRSPGGLWEKYNPNEYATYSNFLIHPEKYWTMHKELRDMVITAQPNPAHLALATLELEYGKLKVIITQNVDFLHSRAGNTKVLEIHGTTQTSRCLSCDKRFHFTEVEAFLDQGQIPPRCPQCEGLIKTNTILFGEQLPYDVMEQAREEVIAADLLIIIGSSLTVYPAAALPSLAVQTGKRILIVNREITPMDIYANVAIRGMAGIIMPKILSTLKELIN
ncbi:MAG: NAD-dependent deacylase [Candidatus Heimdallarchaeota archaeon]|nr:MAG: NAD-dependent deacylase [Candidatus Heimdallarchaeota archaeon]